MARYSRSRAERDAEGELDVPVVATTDWGYVRLRRPAYSAAALKAWVQRVREQETVHGCAVE